MGLDQTLSKRTYVKTWEHTPEPELFKIKVERGLGTTIEPERISYIIEEVGCWRKANAIHQWFVDNVQEGVDDCKEHYVTEANLKELLLLVRSVLENNKLAPKLLPTQSGFFFGSTDYGEFYIEDLKLTKQIIEDALKEGGNYYYSSSW